MRVRALVPVLLLGLGACDAASTTSTRPDWPAAATRYIEATFKADPYFAVYQGRHDYDGILPDWSDAGIKAEVARLKRALAELEAHDTTSLDDAQRFEHAYLVAETRKRLFWLDTADWARRNPAFYTNNALDPNVYVTRPYAPAAVRLKAFIKYANALPVAVAQIKANLSGPLPRSYVDYGLAAFNGYADYFEKDVKAAFAEVNDARLQADLDAARGVGAKAMRDLATWIEGKRATQTEAFALGADTFAAMLRETEGVDVSLDALERIGRADLKRNQDALASACAKLAPGKPLADCMAIVQNDKPADGPVAEARRQLPGLKDFLIKADLVSIPGPEEAKVEESPPFNRQNSAYIDIPGPYEKGLPSVYYISPPDPSWPEKVQREFIPGKLDLLFTSVHEVWPGHFLNFLHANRAKSEVGKVFVGYAFAEGWAHYTEELMVEAGLGGDDPRYRIGQLSNAMLRNCRYLSAIGLHARGWSLEQSQDFFKQQCYQDEGTAIQQSKRGTYDPAYLNYTLGKLMIRKLRDDWTKGDRAKWKAFHDAFLGYGGPPIPMVRQAMLKEPAATAVF
jgi:uncharacterized protein (DUF885 family)